MNFCARLHLVRLFIFSSCILLTACASLVPTPTSLLSDKVSLSKTQAIQAWQRVLEEVVNHDGYVDYVRLKSKPADLHAYVRYIAESRFSDFSSKAELLAHHINAYNALSMFNVLSLGIPESNQRLWDRYQFFIARRHTIGGTPLSLYQYENDIIRRNDEPRIHFALNCSSVSCPTLPRQAFTAEHLESELMRETRQFFSDSRHLRVDNSKREVHLSQILEFFPEDFVPKHAPSLLDYARRYAPEKFALPSQEYRLLFIPYDWTIAKQP